MEFSKKNNTDENSEKKSQQTNWALIFSQMMKHYGMNINDLLDLSYPQFKALYSVSFDPRTFNVTIPYMGSGDNNKDKTNEIKQKENEVTSKEGLMQMIARANSGWKQ